MTPYPAFAKIPRLSKDVVITEKIDGTNALVSVELVPLAEIDRRADADEPIIRAVVDATDPSCASEGVVTHGYVVKAGSRNRWLTPGADNFGFAQWVEDHVLELVKLGTGVHYGEWFGRGIQRGYGLAERRFALFNTAQWYDPSAPAAEWSRGAAEMCPPCCTVVPVLRAYTGDHLNQLVSQAIGLLCLDGSQLVPGYDRPEGVVVFHTAARQLFKVLIENDHLPKSLAA